MMSDLRKASNDGLIALNDKDLIQEAKSYTRNELIDNQPDPRDVNNATRHFDLLTACAIAFAMKNFEFFNYFSCSLFTKQFEPILSILQYLQIQNNISNNDKAMRHKAPK